MTTLIHASAFMPLVLPHVGTCPQIVAEYQVRLAAREFCEMSHAWRVTQNQALAANDEEITLPAGAALHRIEKVKIGETALVPMPYEDRPDRAVSGAPQYVSQATPTSLHLIPFAASTVTITMILKPTLGRSMGGDVDDSQDAYDQVPAFLFADHGETIACGAIANILMMPGQEFSNPQLAGVHRAKFDAGAARAQTDHLRTKLAAPLRSVTHWF